VERNWGSRLENNSNCRVGKVEIEKRLMTPGVTTIFGGGVIITTRRARGGRKNVAGWRQKTGFYRRTAKPIAGNDRGE